MKQELTQRHVHQLSLSPTMQQSLNILQHSSHELLEAIKAEACENPLVDWAGEGMGWGARGSRSGHSGYSDPLDFVKDEGSESLERHLLHQLNCYTGISPEIYRTSKYLISQLDENGYLCPGDFAESEHTFEQALSLLHQLEPAGVGARDLRECLLIQLAQRGRSDTLAYRLVDQWLEEAGERQYSRIAKRLKATVHDVLEALEEIKGLNPKPGAIFARGKEEYVSPDVWVERIGENDFTVQVNRCFSSSVRIDESYLKLAKIDKEATEYLQRHLQSVRRLIVSIEQRERTIQAVTEMIVECQRNFFRYGKEALRALSMSEVAQRLNIHESTVGRTVSGKYVQTHHGLFALSFFFSSGVHRNDKDTIASESIKEVIRQYLRSESSAQPYSDQQLTDFLQQRGILISRRTVAKYREQMGIPSSNKRAIR